MLKISRKSEEKMNCSDQGKICYISVANDMVYRLSYGDV